MILYPTTVLFRVVRVIELALENLKRGKQAPKDDIVNMGEYKRIVELPKWAEIEKRFAENGQTS